MKLFIQITKIVTLILSLFVVQATVANMLIFEINSSYQPKHIDFVESIACDSFEFLCQKVLVNDLSKSDVSSETMKKISESSTVNLSFVLNPPIKSELGHPERFIVDTIKKLAYETYLKQSKFMNSMIEQNKNTLFVAAAGNGLRLEVVHLPGVGLTKKTPLYPAKLEATNLLIVAAVNKTSSELIENLDFKISQLSNFGLEVVDVAAAAELPDFQDSFYYTSFSAPNVAKVSEALIKIDRKLSPSERAQIIRRSCYVPNVEGALWATKDLRVNGRYSITYKAQYQRYYYNRLKIVDEYFKDIFFVKCGGVLIEEIAYQCARNYKESRHSPEDINSSCLKAQREHKINFGNDLSHLSRLWKLRDL